LYICSIRIVQTYRGLSEIKLPPNYIKIK